VVALGAPQGSLDQLVVREPSFAEGFAQLWASEPLEDWKAWLTFHVVSDRAPYLNDELVEANFDFYGRTLTGAQELRDRWKRGVALVQGVLGEAVGKVYVERHFPPSHKERMEQLVANLVEAYRQSIAQLDWMGEETRAKAQAKLDKFTPKIGYPAKWRDYSALVVTPDDLVGNVRRASAFEQDRELNKIGKPIDRDEWFMTPQTVNAYYNPGMNEIVFPAAILQPPFFDADADDAVNYGGIGAVIGHEIGHGFDDQGSKYDGDGRLEDWWTADDRAEFEKRTKALIDQYSQFSPQQLTTGQKVNGGLTIGENIGDLGGLSIALEAYRIALGTSLDEAPVIDGFTGAQRVFLGWAQVWQSKGRDEEVVRRLATDPHSPNEFRCNGVVRNVDEFYAAFDVQPGDALYLEPAERVRIW
jgi:putative endopeptidase